MNVEKATEIFQALDDHLISEGVTDRISDSIEHHFSELKKLNLSEEEFQKALVKLVAVESVRQAVFIACLLNEFDPDKPFDPRDFIKLVK